MEFSKKKLPKEALAKLYRVRVGTIQPCALMLAPVYLYLKANEKFVAVKAPMDFFTEADLARLKSFNYFYCSESVYATFPFREAGEKAREILDKKLIEPAATPEDPYPPVTIPPPPYELSDSVLRVIGPLWWERKEGVVIEPFLVAVFVNALCDLFAPEVLLKAREQDMESYYLALFRSSWVVFLALHLGYTDLDFLNELRGRVFQDNIAGTPSVDVSNELDELISISYASLTSIHTRMIKADYFKKLVDKVAQKIHARLERIKKDFLSRGSFPPTIYGKRGFIDV